MNLHTPICSPETFDTALVIALLLGAGWWLLALYANRTDWMLALIGTVVLGAIGVLFVASFYPEGESNG